MKELLGYSGRLLFLLQGLVTGYVTSHVTKRVTRLYWLALPSRPISDPVMVLSNRIGGGTPTPTPGIPAQVFVPGRTCRQILFFDGKSENVGLRPPDTRRRLVRDNAVRCCLDHTVNVTVMMAAVVGDQQGHCCRYYFFPVSHPNILRLRMA
jgi:hypothetical protein